jgi:hypothetical protein
MGLMPVLRGYKLSSFWIKSPSGVLKWGNLLLIMPWLFMKMMAMLSIVSCATEMRFLAKLET